MNTMSNEQSQTKIRMPGYTATASLSAKNGLYRIILANPDATPDTQIVAQLARTSTPYNCDNATLCICDGPRSCAALAGSGQCTGPLIPTRGGGGYCQKGHGLDGGT